MEWLVVTVPLNMEVKAADFRSQLETPHVACRCVYPAGMSTQLLQTHQLHTQCKLATSCVATATVVLGPSKYTLLLSWTYWHGLNNTLTIHELHDFWFKHVKSGQTLQELVCQQKIHRQYLCLKLYL